MENSGGNRLQPFPVTDEMRREIAGAVRELDLAQMAVVAKLTPAQRVHIAASMIQACEQVGVYRLRQRQPELSEAEAYRIVRGGLLNYYQKRPQ
jgi:hypothetical protein